MRTAGLQSKLEGLEARLAQLDVELAVPAPSPIRLHPSHSDPYRSKTGKLAATLPDPDVRPSALDALRGLIKQVVVYDGPDGTMLELEGALAAMVGLAQKRKNPPVRAGFPYAGCGDQI